MTDPETLAELRVDYETAGLDESMLADDPIRQFELWMSAAIEAGLTQPNTMILATADPHGGPSARAVLLKHVDQRGFVLYTNLDSRKGRELASNPRASLVFVWQELHRQVRVEGTVVMGSAEEADAYFATRPREAQVAAVASPQSRAVTNRQELDDRYAAVAAREGPVERPANWGGVRVVPTVVEFWQGRPNRFHDRLVYTRAEREWIVQRLAP